MPRWPAESSLTVVSKAHSRRSTVGKSRNLITDKECMFFLWRSPEKKIFYAKKKLKEKKQKKIIAYRIWYVNILCFFFFKKKAVLWGAMHYLKFSSCTSKLISENSCFSRIVSLWFLFGFFPDFPIGWSLARRVNIR